MQVMDAVREEASITGYNKRNVRKYCNEFFCNKGEWEETKRGKVQMILYLPRRGDKPQGSSLGEKACFSKGSSKHDSLYALCEWINNDLPHCNFLEYSGSDSHLNNCFSNCSDTQKKTRFKKV